jgi:hypothetical protein
MADGTVIGMKAGDLFYIPPGHDSWVVDDEPYVSLHFLRAALRGNCILFLIAARLPSPAPFAFPPRRTPAPLEWRLGVEFRLICMLRARQSIGDALGIKGQSPLPWGARPRFSPEPMSNRLIGCLKPGSLRQATFLKSDLKTKSRRAVPAR